MASHSGDGSPQEPLVREDKKIPLKELCFTQPTKIPGITTMLTLLVANERRLVDGQDWYPPPMWLDPVRREVCINDRRYPIERVHYYERLKVAGKLPPPIDSSKYTIGKRPKK
jgi:hypothetical protein